MKKALILGISGQDGAYLADFLLKKGYSVVGTSRRDPGSDFANVQALGLRDKVMLLSLDPTDAAAVRAVFSDQTPDEIYYLAGLSSVSRSFEQPAEAFVSNGLGAVQVLEALRALGGSSRLFYAGSGECFGDTHGLAATEQTPLHPLNPYAVAKAAGAFAVDVYRKAYGLFACTGWLFNHESPLRPETFVTCKIVKAACRIAEGAGEPLRLGNIAIARDWGYAPEYVDAMWRMLQQETPEDYVIATGKTVTLREFVAVAFAAVGLDWQDHVVIAKSLFRPTDVAVSRADPTKAARRLRWEATVQATDVARLLIAHEQRKDALLPFLR